MLEVVAACTGVIQALSFQQGKDPANTDYAQCLKYDDCMAEIAAVCIEGAIEESGENSEQLAACTEGLVSGILHTGAELWCKYMDDPCGPAVNWKCIAYSTMMDVVAGCIEGFIGNLVPEGKGIKKAQQELIRGLVEGVAEYILSVGGMTSELGCDDSYIMKD